MSRYLILEAIRKAERGEAERGNAGRLIRSCSEICFTDVILINQIMNCYSLK
jgi:hypothetical protein